MCLEPGELDVPEEEDETALRAWWEARTRLVWPRYTVEDFAAEPLMADERRVGDPWDIWHIIPLGHGGRKVWWNVHPARLCDFDALHDAYAKVAALAPPELPRPTLWGRLRERIGAALGF
jgi:hypothetical protein